MGHFIYGGEGNTRGENTKIRYGEEADFIRRVIGRMFSTTLYEGFSVHSFELSVSKRLRCISEGIVLQGKARLKSSTVLNFFHSIVVHPSDSMLSTTKRIKQRENHSVVSNESTKPHNHHVIS